jgi:hypothetical protein
MAFLAENYPSQRQKDDLWPSPGYDGPPRPEGIPYSMYNTQPGDREYVEDDKFARVHFYLEPGKDRKKDGIFIGCKNCGQVGHIKTNRKSVPFPEIVCVCEA